MDDAVNALLTDAAGRVPGNELKLTVRELISHWGAKRRGFWYVEAINRDLARFDLTTIPSFEVGWIDNTVTLVPLRRAPEPASVEVSQESGSAEPPAAAGLSVAILPSASGGVVSVTRDDTLARAQSLMLAHDYSQLPVMSGERKLDGVVSWTSIAQQRMAGSSVDLRDCIVPAEVVTLTDPLLSHIPRIIERDYVFVRALDQRICGLITVADLSMAFRTLAEPFLTIGEVERQLRRIIDGSFTAEEMAAVRAPGDEQRTIDGAKDLTIGECRRLFEPPNVWSRFPWEVDRGVFLDGLDALRTLRNETMHFSADPIEDDHLEMIRNLLRWLTLLPPAST